MFLLFEGSRRVLAAEDGQQAHSFQGGYERLGFLNNGRLIQSVAALLFRSCSMLCLK